MLRGGILPRCGALAVSLALVPAAAARKDGLSRLATPLHVAFTA